MMTLNDKMVKPLHKFKIIDMWTKSFRTDVLIVDINVYVRSMKRDFKRQGKAASSYIHQ